MHYSIRDFMHKSPHTESVPRNSHALRDLCITSICIVRMSTVECCNLSVVCFHTPTVRRAAHSIADGNETTIHRTSEFQFSSWQSDVVRWPWDSSTRRCTWGSNMVAFVEPSMLHNWAKRTGAGKRVDWWCSRSQLYQTSKSLRFVSQLEFEYCRI